MQERKKPLIIEVCAEIVMLAFLIPAVVFKLGLITHMKKQMVIGWNNRIDQTREFMKQVKHMAKCAGCPRHATCQKHHDPK